MRHLKIVLPISIGLLLVITGFGCSSGSAAPQASQNQSATAKRGNLALNVTASGNLAFSQTADLAFEFGTATTPAVVDKVLVEAGDPVKKGQVLAELDVEDWNDQKLALERSLIQAKINLNKAKLTLEGLLNPTTGNNALTGVGSAPDPLEVDNARLALDIATADLKKSQQALDKWLLTSPQVLAPFDGFVTKVNIKGGDEVKKGTIAVSVADPARFEAEVLVNEIDIPRIQIGTQASVTATSLPGLTLSAKVISISPTATVSGGVVNYPVKVEIQGPRLPQGFARSAPVDGQTTPASGSRSFQGSTSGEGQLAAARTGSQGMPSLTAQLRQGLSITVTLNIEEKQDVILVPSKAVTRQGRDSIVRVLGTDGIAQVRVVKVGASDLQNTEITEGLSEGELVVVQQSTTSTSTQQGQFRMGIPGIGGSPPPPPGR